MSIWGQSVPKLILRDPSKSHINLLLPHPSPLCIAYSVDLQFLFLGYYHYWIHCLTWTRALKPCPYYYRANVCFSIGRSSCREVFCKKGVLKNFAKFTGNRLCQSLPEFANLLKKRLWHKCFPLNIANFLRTPFLIGHLQWLLLYWDQGFSQGNFSSVSFAGPHHKSHFLQFLTHFSSMLHFI